MFLKRILYEIITSESDINVSDARAITNPNLHLSCYFEYFIYAEMSTMQLKMAQKKHLHLSLWVECPHFIPDNMKCFKIEVCIYFAFIDNFRESKMPQITYPYFDKSPTQRYT